MEGSMSSTVFRAQKDANHPYKSMCRATFEDGRLSWEARGMLGYLLVKPDDWRINVANLIKQSPGGRDRVYRILNELIEYNYIKRTEIRREGKISGYEYAVYETPHTEKPQQFSTTQGEPVTSGVDDNSPLPEKPYTALPLTEKAYISNKEELTKEEELLVAAQPALIAPDTPTAAPEPPPRVKKPRVSGGKKEASPTTQEILAGYAELKGIEIDYGMEGVWAKKLGEAGATRESVAGCYKWLKTKPYYEEIPVTLATVYKNWPEYTHHLEKRKPTPKPSVITIYNQYTGQHEERRLS
jgi:hypothetical protein